MRSAYESAAARPSTLAPRTVLTSMAGVAAGPSFLAAGWNVEGTIPRAALAGGGTPFMRSPARLIIEFGRPDSRTIRIDAHQATQIPLALAMPYCTSVQIALAVTDAPNVAGARYRMVALSFATASDMVTFLSSSAGQHTLAHIAAIATGGATARIETDLPASG